MLLDSGKGRKVFSNTESKSDGTKSFNSEAASTCNSVIATETKPTDIKSSMEVQVCQDVKVKTEPMAPVEDKQSIHPKQELEGVSPDNGTLTTETIKTEGTTPISVERAIANLQTIVSETAAQPDTERASQPGTEEGSLCMKQEPNVKQEPKVEPPLPALSSPQHPQDDLAKLEQVCSEIQNQNENLPVEGKTEPDSSLPEEMKNEPKVPDRSAAATRCRGRGRGRRGGRRPTDAPEDAPGTSLPITRSGAATRGKGRGRGRQTRITESQKDVQADLPVVGLTDKTMPEPRRSSRTKRARRHPDMVDHEETSGRRRRGRGGRATQPEDSRPLPPSTTSDVYDFHESEDEDINLGLAKSKIKKDPTRPVAGRSPVKPEVEEVRRVENDDKNSIAPITRRSGRLRDKVPEDESQVGGATDEGGNSDPIVIDTLASAPSTMAATSQPASLVTTVASPVQTMSTRGRGRGKPRDVEIKRDTDAEEDWSVRKSPRGRARTSEPQLLENEKPVTCTPLSLSTVTVTTVITGTTVVTSAVTTTNAATVVVSSVEERKSEAELVDPVTGVVTRVKVCEEGQYVTDSGETGIPTTTQSIPTADHLNKQKIALPSLPTNNNNNSICASVVSSSASVDTSHATTLTSRCRPGVTMTVVNSSNIGSRVGEVSVELVPRVRAPVTVPTQVTAGIPTKVPTIAPVIHSTLPTMTPTQVPPVRATIPAAVTLGGPPRPAVMTPAHMTKQKPVQLQQPTPQVQPQTVQHQPQLSQQQQLQQKQVLQQQQQQVPVQQQPQSKVCFCHILNVLKLTNKLTYPCDEN